MKHLLKLMRPHHYIKNILIFAALACSGQLFQPEKLLAGGIGFVAFCLVASAVYIINDIRDVEKDRLHPVKCSRPIASGAVPVKAARIQAAVLLLLAAALNGLVYHGASTLLLALYLALNVAYSFGLKDVPILDVTILASGFLIRVLYGAYITQIDVSSWLYLTVMVLAFYLSLGKRRNELKRTDGATRKVLRAYPIQFLDRSMNMCMTLALTFYALWSLDGNKNTAYGSYLVLTVPIALLIIMKYSLDIEGDSDGDPVEVLIHDKVLLGLCGIFFAAVFLILYL